MAQKKNIESEKIINPKNKKNMETKGFNIEMWKLKNLVKKMEQEERKVIRKMTGSQFLKMLMDGKELYEHWIK